MVSDWRWIEPDVVVERQAGGALILRNGLALEPYPANLASWLRRHAAKSPDKSFLRQRGAGREWQGLSYGQTLAAVNGLSNGLLELDLEPDAPIAILSENRVEMAVLQLAAMQIGHPVVPISFAYSVRSQTGSHIKHILDRTRAPMLVMSDAALHMPKLGQWELGELQLYAFNSSASYPAVESLDSLASDAETLTAEGERRFAAVGHDTLAKVQFTSGSTALPKGAMISHGMMTSNQVGIAQTWPFLNGDEVFLDWLPWNHTFGGNFVFNMALMRGGTFYIDDGNPTPDGLERTVQNIFDVAPTVYFGVPRSYTALYARMKEDEGLREAFFGRLKFIFTAAAALDQATYEGMKELSRNVRGRSLPFFSAWGCTETAPDATHVYWEISDARVIGLPLPGTTVKLAPDPSGKLELRVKGPNVTSGYYNEEEASAAAFDQDGYYLTGDAGKFLDPRNPTAGLIFDGRIGEDFKLSSGVWVHNAALRGSINKMGQPLLLDVVVAAPGREYLTALIIPNTPLLRRRLPSESADMRADSAFIESEPVVALFRSVLRKHNEHERGSSRRFVRFAMLSSLPSIDRNETTDKGYINQSAVLASQAELVAELYADPPPASVHLV